MDEDTETTAEEEREPPTFEQLMEEQFFREVRQGLEAWREAGKPHER